MIAEGPIEFILESLPKSFADLGPANHKSANPVIASDLYDLVIVGGGIGGSTLAKVMCEFGARVLILEKETSFKDRVRGDAVAPWGVSEARCLGIEQLLLDTCGHLLPWVDNFINRFLIEHRHLPSTTPGATGQLAFYHPAMQEVLLQAAEDAGAVVVRGAGARQVHGGSSPAVTFEKDAATHVARSRLVVGADGRNSLVRRLGGFVLSRDPQERLLAGVLLEGMKVRQDTIYSVFDPPQGRLVALFPQGHDRVRAYFSYPNQSLRRLQGAADVPDLIAQSQLSGAPAEWYDGARAIGPLASFASDDTWVAHPYHNGVVLVGDAAASNDPMYGQGLSLTLRDVRVLWQHLTANDDWHAACHAYAADHDTYFDALHSFSHWFESIFYRTGREANLLRARVLPLLSKDRSRMPDYFMSGPDKPITEETRQRMFGEDRLRPVGR